MFDGNLGKNTSGSNYTIELKEDAKLYHAKPFPIPKIYEPTHKKEVIHKSQWAAPTFIISENNGAVRFISDFRQINKTIKTKPFPIPKHT